MKELQSNIKAVLAIAPVALGTTGLITGRSIDRKGYGGVEFILEYGAVTTSGTIATVIVQDGDTTAGFASAADADLIGTEALASLLATTTARVSAVSKLVDKRIGYKGGKRFVRINVNGTGTTSVGVIAASAILHTPEAAPVANP